MSREADFSKPIKTELAKRVGYLCSSPRCRKLTVGPNVDPNKSTISGEAAHIVDAVDGPDAIRPDPALTPEQRASQDNGIWLCASCHTIVDKDRRFTIAILRAWKMLAEAEADGRNLGGSAAVGEAPVVVSIGQSGGKIADQIARTIINAAPPPRRVDVAQMSADVASKIKARPVSTIRFSCSDGDREAHSLMRNMMHVCRYLGLPVDPVEGVRISTGLIGSVVFLCKDAVSTDVDAPLRVLAEWALHQGLEDVHYNGQEIEVVSCNEVYIGPRPLG